MHRLPKMQKTQPSPAAVARLSDWLRFWRAMNEPDDESSDEDSTPVPGAARAGSTGIEPAPFDPDPQVGEIRLMSPSLFSDSGPTARMVYMAIIRDWDDDLLVAAPFGPIPEPATPGELKMHRKEFGFQVLCLWNARSLSKETLAKSWIADDLTNAEVAEAWSVFAHAMTGKALPEHLKERVGPSIRKPEDPRLDYVAAETRLLNPLMADLFDKVLAPTEPTARHYPVLRLDERARGRIHAASSELALAAATGETSRIVFIDVPADQALREIRAGNLPNLAAKLDQDHPRAVLALPPQPGEGENQAFAQWKIEGSAASVAGAAFFVLVPEPGTILGEGEFSPDGRFATLRRGNLADFQKAQGKEWVLVAVKR